MMEETLRRQQGFSTALEVDPLVSLEAPSSPFDEGIILSPVLLKHYLNRVANLLPITLSARHAKWIERQFPEITGASPILTDIPSNYLTQKAGNVGTVEKATAHAREWINDQRPTIYWTGGLEFTRGQFESASYLLKKGCQIIMGIEPRCYLLESEKKGHHFSQKPFRCRYGRWLWVYKDLSFKYLGQGQPAKKRLTSSTTTCMRG